MDRGVQNLEFVLQQMHTLFTALTRYEANDIVVKSRKNPLEAWRRLQKRVDPTTGRRTKSCVHDHFSWTVFSSGVRSGDRTLGVPCVAIREWLKDKLDDDIKFVGLEALVFEELEKHLNLESLEPEELEKHLNFNSGPLRTFEDARLNVVTCVEAKFGFGIRDSKPSDTGVRGHSDPMDVDAVNSLSSGKGKGTSSPRDGRFKCGGAQYQRDCNARKSTGKQSFAKGKQSKSWSQSEGKGKRQ